MEHYEQERKEEKDHIMLGILESCEDFEFTLNVRDTTEGYRVGTDVYFIFIYSICFIFILNK